MTSRRLSTLRSLSVEPRPDRRRFQGGRLVVALCLAAVSFASSVGCQRKMATELSYSSESALALRDVLESGVEGGGGGGGPSLGEPTGWATLTGTFRIEGSAPTMTTLTVNKDTEVCAPGGAQVFEESVVVGSGGGLKNVLIFISSKLPTDDPMWEHEQYQATKTAEVEFDQKACIFLSHVAAMRSTQRLKVLNSDPVGHNTNLDSKRGAAAGNFTVPANSFAYYDPGAASPAPFSVSCSIHPWMKAHMMVCDHPYFAVTDAEGKFEIKNVPAGVELEYRVWQERTNFLQEVTVDGQSQKWSKGRFKLALSADETRDMQVVVDASRF